MSLFKKTPPKACPKCGRADGWHCVTDTLPQSNASDAGLGNPFYFDMQRDPNYNGIGTSKPKERIHYRCESCGYEKTY